MEMRSQDSETLIQQNVGARIRQLRRAMSMTAVQLATSAGISQSQLSKIETGKATISVKILEQLCRTLERPLSYLFQSEEEIPRVLGTLNTVAGPESEGVNWFAEEVRRRTRGRMSLIPLRASQLGPPADQVEQLRQGVIDLFIEELAHFQKYIPALNIFSLPYAFASDAKLNFFLESDYFCQHIRSRLLEHGFRFINKRWNWRRGLQWVLVSHQPIVSPDQIRGLRVRIYDSKILHRFWEEMGARPIVVPWPEVKNALRQKDVDVVPTHKAHVFPLKFCQHARYITLLGDDSPVLGAAINELKYRALPPDIQDALHCACDAAGDRFSQVIRESEQRNEALNMATYQAVYLKVDIVPWQRQAIRIRRLLVESEQLSAQLLDELETPNFSNAIG